MKKKGKKKGVTVLVCIVAIAVILTCTPGMALRTAAFTYDMGSAFKLEFEKIMEFDNNWSLYEITENAPVEKSTQGELVTWKVYRFGPFHFATYYGEAGYGEMGFDI